VGTLYLVATPIGNLQDISARALNTLRAVTLIAAEDTRRTRVLLDHYQIRTPVISYYEHNKLARLEQVLAVLAQGDVGLVSDAGTPALNDPGYELVCAAIQAGYPVSPIPGPSAPIAALTASGLPTDAFLYLGYLPRKTGERRARLAEVAELPYTLVFLESPHRALAALQDLQAVLGERQIAVARELTKLYEEIVRGNLSQAIEYFRTQPPRGEITFIVEGQRQPPAWSEAELEQTLQAALAAGLPIAQAAGQIASQSGWPRRQVYRRLTALQARSGKAANSGENYDQQEHG
jgi:16S rRNA (cytidine1402-2'-O)-methyltransferase